MDRAVFSLQSSLVRRCVPKERRLLNLSAAGFAVVVVVVAVVVAAGVAAGVWELVESAPRENSLRWSR